MTEPLHLAAVRGRTRTRRGRRRGTRLIATAALLPLTLGLLVSTSDRPANAAAASTRVPTAAAVGTDGTSPAWSRLADRVPTPVLHWTSCRGTAQCATAQLPLDYDDPHGPTIGVALLRIPAEDPAHRLGTLFVNPGGPGDSARDIAAEAPLYLSTAVLDRFDVVGVDPRGVGGSRQIQCFSTPAGQNRVLAPLAAAPFPETPAEQRSWIEAAEAFGRACSTTAGAIASAMSTTDDALDMDVLRRAVGDGKLTYLGESYGSYLGLVYANMFPDRVRAVAIDGIVDPQALVGTPATADVPTFIRLGSAAASQRALEELLELCQRAGPAQCPFADADTPARFDQLAARLRAHPLRLAAPGVKATTYTYADLIADTGQWLRDDDGYEGLFADLTDLARLAAPGGAGPDHAAVVRDFLLRHPEGQPGPGTDGELLEASSGVLCADGLNAADAASWPAAAAAADRESGYFGADWAWATVECARDTWTAQDQDVYRGPFDRRTAAPVLVVGGWWDPATSYDSAVQVARQLPDSRLVSSDSWGHGSLLTSACVDDAVYDYLISPLAPAPKTTTCRGDVQPFGLAPSAPE